MKIIINEKKYAEELIEKCSVEKRELTACINLLSRYLYHEKGLKQAEIMERLLIGILFDASLVKLNSVIIDGNLCQWQGLHRHKCPIDTDFVYDVRQSSRA